MIVLGQKKEPLRIVLSAAASAAKGRKAEPEAFVVMAPITAPMRRRAARATRLLLGEVNDLSDVDMDRLIDASEAGARELVRLGMIEWGGIGDAGGTPLELTPDRDTRFATANEQDRPTGSIDLLLEDEDLLDRIAGEYVRPDALRRAEKNASSASLNGTGEAATRARTTAGSPAARSKKRSAAKAARTASTRSARKRAKPSGKR